MAHVNFEMYKRLCLNQKAGKMIISSFLDGIFSGAKGEFGGMYIIWTYQYLPTFQQQMYGTTRTWKGSTFEGQITFMVQQFNSDLG